VLFQPKSAGETGGFVPISPLRSEAVTYYDESGQKITKAWPQLKDIEKHTLLSNQYATISTSKAEASGTIKYLNAGITAEAGSYRVILDYMKYRLDQRPDGFVRVGVGLRLTAKIQTTKENLDLGSLVAVGFAAKAGSVRGTLEVECIGINSDEITLLFPTPSQIDETTIQKALEAVASIKSKINDPKTKLDPQEVAWMPFPGQPVSSEKLKAIL
jgi:hypothetical protein